VTTPVITSAIGGQPGTLMMGLSEMTLCDRRGAGRVRLGRLHAAPGGAGAPGDDRLGVGHGFLISTKGLPPIDAVHAVLVERRVALDGQDVVALVLLHDLFEDGLGLVAGGGHQRVVVVERDHRQHHVLGQRVRRADEGLGAAGAFQAVQPDHRRARLGLHGVAISARSRPQAQRGGGQRRI
jgi:hypothetical protein